MSPLFYLGLIPTLSLLVIHIMWISDSRNTPGSSAAPHVIGVVIVLLVLGGAAAWQVITTLRDDAADHKPPLQEMQTIEASLAVKKTKVTQPQKPHEEPPPPVKPEGVSHDDKKKPDPKPPEEKKDPPKPNQPVDNRPLDQRFPHAHDDDTKGTPVTQIGDFNGSEHGFATETKGDPYIQALLADMQVDLPQDAKDTGTPVGCIHITPEGRIPDTMFMEQTSGAYQTWAQLELKQLKDARNKEPKPVPDKLLLLTTKWLCFKFTVAQ
jgi:hypothetical protein